MASKVLGVLLALLLGVAFVNCQDGSAGTDPEGQIDPDAFVARWQLSSDAVAQRVQEAADLVEQDEITIIGPDGIPRIVSNKPKCEEGPVVRVFQEEGFYYYPQPQFTSCSGLDCKEYYDPDHNCEATKTCTRNFYTICYKEFNCWGVKVWIPIGIKQLHLTDESYCECKPRCKPFSCFPPRYYNPYTCDCQCPNITCYKPYALDDSSCSCRCPKDIICPYPTELNLTTCKCECKNECPPYYKPDPEKNCTCVPICRRECPKGSYLDLETCKCVGECSRFRNEYDCNAVDSCKESRSRKCRWFPTFPHKPCQCDRCVTKEGYDDYDCWSYTPFGKFTCNFYYDWKTKARPCTWVAY